MVRPSEEVKSSRHWLSYLISLGSENYGIFSDNLGVSQREALEEIGAFYPGPLVSRPVDNSRNVDWKAANVGHCIAWHVRMGVLSAKEARLLLLEHTLGLTEGSK